MTGITKLITWLVAIKCGRQPEIPYNLHALIKCLHSELGTTDAIALLSYLQDAETKELLISIRPTK